MIDQPDSPHERLAWARVKAGFSDKADFARAVGVNTTTYRAYENGQNGFAKYAAAFAKKLGVTSDWLLEGGPTPAIVSTSNRNADELPRNQSFDDFAAEHGIVFLEEIDLALGMGATYLDGTAEVRGIVPFKEEWLSGLFSGSLQHLKVVRGRGDSMQPTIMDGDLVIIDTGRRRIDDQDRIWALSYGDLGMIRRIRVTPRGSWMLMPDNAVVRPDEVGDGEASIMGRVIWIGRGI